MMGKLKNKFKNFMRRLVRKLAKMLKAEGLGRSMTEQIKLTPSSILENLELNIVDHCDLHCKGCSHFSPVSKRYVVPVAQLKQDLEKLSALTNQTLGTLKIIGGEPMLHPDLLEIMGLARQNFPYSRIRLVTNGLTLLDQQEDFWESCRQNKILISPTKYPIDVDYDKIQAMADAKGVAFRYYSNAQVIKTLRKDVIDLEGLQKPVESFLACSKARNCAMLNGGKLYLCPVAATAYILNEAFDTKLRVLPGDYLDLQAVQSQQEIHEFLAKPIPFCRYCNIKKMEKNHPWSRSEHQLSEWVDESQIAGKN